MTRRRKRLLIVTAALAVLASAGWWLTRPRIDPRLVGKWRSFDENLALGQGWVFRCDGTGEVAVGDRDQSYDEAYLAWFRSMSALSGEETQFRWRADDDAIVVSDSGVRNLLPAILCDWYERISNTSLSGREVSRIELEWIAPDRMLMRFEGDPFREFARVAD